MSPSLNELEGFFKRAALESLDFFKTQFKFYFYMVDFSKKKRLKKRYNVRNFAL
jgi:hypothetical protein